VRIVLRVAIRYVLPDEADRLRDWLREVAGPRRKEALATLIDEGCRHEQAYLIDGANGPVVVSVMEVEDVEQSKLAASRSAHAIDAEHRRVLAQTLGAEVPAELLLDLMALHP
jgi:hypothetical protein